MAGRSAPSILALVCAMVFGCHREPSHPDATDSRTNVPIAAVAQAQPLWFRRVMMRDVTGDGQPDSLILSAFGTHSDSLKIAFTIVSKGSEVFRESWHSDDELVDPPFPPHPPVGVVDSFMRATLDSFFSHTEIAPFDSADVNSRFGPSDCPIDAPGCDSIVADVRRNAKVVFRFSYGYESTI